MFVLRNANIFDGSSETLLRNCTVMIESGKLKEIRVNDPQKDWDCESVDCQGYTLMPGLIDCHMHLLLYEVPDHDIQLNDRTPGGEAQENTLAYLAYRGAFTARKVLQAGFTTIFDGGGINFIDVALRDAIHQGVVEGPDAYVCGQQITAGRSHFQGLGYDAVGVDEMRRAVRKMMWYGVNHIKIKMSAPMRMPGRNTERSEFTMPELTAAVDEAHSAGLSVSVHARGAKAIMDSLNAGVDRIVHGTGIDDQCIDYMLAHDIYLYPTLNSPPKDPPPSLVAVKTNDVIESVRRKGKQHFDSVKRAYDAGVKMAFSTDSGVMGVMAGDNVRELLCWKNLGMSNLEILKAATSAAADAVGLSDRIGLIREGFDANLILVEGNPLENLDCLYHTKLIIKAGKVYKNTLAGVSCGN